MTQFSLLGSTALVTGASGYLGQHMCQALGEQGARLMVVGRDEKKLDDLKVKLRESGFDVESFACDLLQDDAASRIHHWLSHLTESLDILVNNAHGVRKNSRQNPAVEDFQEATRLAVSFPYQIVYQLLPLLKKGAHQRRGGASVVQIASIYGENSPRPQLYIGNGLNSPPHYGAAKAGMLQLTRHLATHLAPEHIRVNSLVLGPFPSKEIIEKFPSFISRLGDQIPLGRCGDPDEIAGPLLFLTSSASSYCTGTSLHVDGGWTIW